MNIIRLGFCLGLGVIAYKSFSKEDIKLLYKISTEKFLKCTPFFKNILGNFNSLLSATTLQNNLTDNDAINERIIKLNESIKSINEAEIQNIKFKKMG